MSERVEKEYNSLIEKRKTVEHDKLLLLNNMDELDKKVI
jgi:hypothetical protein